MVLRRKPILIPGPDGVLMPKKAADQAWKDRNRKVREEGAIELGNKRRASANRGRDMERDQDQKDRSVRESRVTERWGKLASRLRGFGARLRNDLPLLATLITAGTGLVVTLSGQWMFYATLPWPTAFLWLIVPLSLLVESGSWTYGIHAQWLADRGQPYGKQIRRMWGLALLAASMNVYHGASSFPGHPEMGLILGGGSILSPMAWHGYVYLTKSKERGRSGREIRAAVGRRLHHPILTWRAHDLWSSTGGRMSPERAFLIVYRARFGYLPGQAPVPSAGVSQRSPAAEPASPVSAESSGTPALTPGAETVPAEHPVAADSAVVVPPAMALVGGDGSAPEETLTDDEIERFLATLDSADSALSQRQNARSTPVSDGVDQRVADGEVSGLLSADRADVDSAESAASDAGEGRSAQRRPAGSRQRRRALKASNEDRIREYVDGRIKTGEVLESITGPAVAAALKIGESTARNLLAKVKKEMSDQPSS